MGFVHYYAKHLTKTSKLMLKILTIIPKFRQKHINEDVKNLGKIFNKNNKMLHKNNKFNLVVHTKHFFAALTFNKLQVIIKKRRDYNV